MAAARPRNGCAAGIGWMGFKPNLARLSFKVGSSAHLRYRRVSGCVVDDDRLGGGAGGGEVGAPVEGEGEEARVGR
eukprot:scaffold33571_cov90-Isochrysis_galbana.AAC.1